MCSGDTRSTILSVYTATCRDARSHLCTHTFMQPDRQARRSIEALNTKPDKIFISILSYFLCQLQYSYKLVQYRYVSYENTQSVRVMKRPHNYVKVCASVNWHAISSVSRNMLCMGKLWFATFFLVA